MSRNVSTILVALTLYLVGSICYATPTITFGPLGSGLNDGTSPFGQSTLDASGNPTPCPSATDTDISGADCGENNRVIRTQDIASHLWSISVNGGDATIPPGDPVLTDVVIRQTIQPSTNASVAFPSLPTACTAIAGAGTNPPSSIVDNADGTSTLTCNLGPFAEGQAKIFAVPVQPSGDSWNGSSYTTTQAVSSIDANGDSNATATAFVDNRPVTISAMPAYDLIHSVDTTQGIRNHEVGTRDVGQGPERGFLAYMQIRVAANRRTGIESISQPITFNDTFAAFSGTQAGPTYPLEFHVTECIANPTGWWSETYGAETLVHSIYQNTTVIDSGSCVYTRDNPTDATSTSFSVALQGADLSGDRYPTQTVGGTDLTAGPYYVINHRVQIFIPFRSVDLADGIAGNDTGTVYLSSLISDFDPSSPSGTSNFGTDNEPGYNGALIDGARSNNQLGTGHFRLVADGNFNKRSVSTVNDKATEYTASSSSNWHGGDGEVEAGQVHAGFVYVGNLGTTGFSNPNACDIFDNTTQQLTDRGGVGATSGTYAYIGEYAYGGMDYTNYTVEYGNIDLSGDDPLDANHDGTNDYDTINGRYNGDWTKQSAARCDDNATSNGWHTNPTQVAGGIDGVNAVRLVLSTAAKAAGIVFEPTHQMRLVVPLKVRDRFVGGPHNGVQIPVGTVLANFGAFKSDNWSPNWTQRAYTPAPESGNIDGDRVTFTRMKLVLDSHSISPYAASGATASTIAGSQIIWQVDTALQSNSPVSGIAENVQIINVLPPEATYNASCTASTPGGTTAGLIQYNTDKDGNPAPGYTRLIWNLGDLAANTLIPPRIICTDSTPLAQDGTAVVNYAEIRTDNILSSLDSRSDTHSIKLEQVGDVKLAKTVDAQLDDRNNSQVYTIAWSNFSEALRIAAPVVIDVFPYSGDNNSPASNFTGALQLAAAPITTWSDGSTPTGTDPNPEIGTWYYTTDTPSTIVTDPDNNTSNWCTEAQFGTAGCAANFAEATAIKFVSHYELEREGNPRQGVKAQVTLMPGTLADNGAGVSNQPGDIYTNRFSLDSNTLPPAQFLTSPNVSVQVASYSIGDFVFADINKDGKYDNSVDYPVPDGVTVDLYFADGTLAATTTTGLEKPGRYLFKLLNAGNYYVEIPASEFDEDQLLEGWQASLINTSENDDKNEVDDQHAFSTGIPIINGVRSGVIAITGNPAPPGGLPTGNEPLADNAGFITDTTGDDFSNLTLDLGLIPDMYEVTGTVWNDANRNGLRENSESGIPNVTVVLKGTFRPGDPERCISVETDANGFYQFDSVTSGKYQLIEADDASVPFGTASCPPAEIDPTGYISTTPNTRDITVYETNLNRQDFGDYGGIVIRGTVFDDNGLSTGVSANQLQDGTEPGIGGIKVIATDANGNIYDSTVTTTDGRYELHVPGSASIVKVTEFNGSGYGTTGAQLGNSGGSYDAAADTITFTATPSTTYSGLDFADIKKPTFEPDHRSTVLPGNVVFYAHTFSTPSQGSLVFKQSSDLSVSSGWTHTLFEDANCDGVLNNGEGFIEIALLSYVVPANGKVCVINKVFAPSNVISQDQHRVKTTATFTNDGGGAASIELVVNDITSAMQTADQTTTQGGASRLELRKSVENVTQNTGETETINAGLPGDVLKYRIYYSNTGTGSITELKINDTPPEYTLIRLLSGLCDDTPASLSCTPAVAFDRIDWKMIGTLEGGAKGSVSYEVEIEQ